MAYDVRFETHGGTEWQCPTCRLAARARDGLLALPNNPLIVAAVQAICAGGEGAEQIEGGWRRNRMGAPTYEFWSGSGGRILVTIDGEAEDGWRDVHSFTALTLDVALGLLSCLASAPFRATTAAPRSEPVWLGAPAILQAKGYKRFGAERLAFASATDRDFEKLLRMRFEMIKYPGFDPAARKWNAAGVSRSGVRLIDVSDAPCPRDAHDCERGLPLRFGEWSQHWLTTAGPMWVSPFPQEILLFDHRENRGADVLAKKVAALIALNWGAARKKDEVCIEVRSLLRRTGELARPGAAHGNHPGRLADRLEEALLRLNEAGILPNTLAQQAALDLRAAGRRWHEAFLESVIVFSRPRFLEPASTPVVRRAVVAR